MAGIDFHADGTIIFHPNFFAHRSSANLCAMIFHGFRQRFHQAAVSMFCQAEATSMTAIAKKTEELSIEKIETATHQGEEYYRIPGPGGSGPKFVGVFFPDNKTIVFGSEKDVKSAIERGSNAEVRRLRS